MTRARLLITFAVLAFAVLALLLWQATSVWTPNSYHGLWW